MAFSKQPLRAAVPSTPKTTEEIRYELGNFEKDLLDSINAEPEFTLARKYGYGSIPDGEMKMMVRYQAITLHDLPYPHTRVAAPAMRWWMEIRAYGVKYNVAHCCQALGIDTSAATFHQALGDIYLTNEMYKNSHKHEALHNFLSHFDLLSHSDP